MGPKDSREGTTGLLQERVSDLGDKNLGERDGKLLRQTWEEKISAVEAANTMPVILASQIVGKVFREAKKLSWVKGGKLTMGKLSVNCSTQSCVYNIVPVASVHKDSTLKGSSKFNQFQG